MSAKRIALYYFGESAGAALAAGETTDAALGAGETTGEACAGEVPGEDAGDFCAAVGTGEVCDAGWFFISSRRNALLAVLWCA